MKIVMLVVTIITIITLETASFAQPSAEDLYAEGQAAYDRADYKAAAAKWQASYDLSKASELLFNLAQAKRLAGDCLGARATYRRFVTAGDVDPTSEQHKLAEDLARELEGQCPEQKSAAVLPPKIVNDPTLDDRLNLHAGRNDRESEHERSGRTWKIAGIVTGGIGIVTIAVGLGLGHHGSSIGDEITAACATSCDWAALKDKDVRGRRAVAIGKTLDAVGVTAIAGGAVFYYLGIRQGTLTVAPARGGSVVSWSGSW
jgi:hypothetical protein